MRLHNGLLGRPAVRFLRSNRKNPLSCFDARTRIGVYADIANYISPVVTENDVTLVQNIKDKNMTTEGKEKLFKGPGYSRNKQKDNKNVIGAWFTHFWGKTCNLQIVDEIAAPDMLLKYSLHEPRRGHADIKSFMTDFRKAFPDLNFWGTADLIAEGDYVVGQWEGGGAHTGPAFGDFLMGSLPANSGRKMHFTGTTVLRLKDNKIVEEIGLDDGVTALTQLGLLIKA
jgi:predicted ester cyclase